MRKIVILFALLFFVIGSLWMYSIYKRGQAAWPKGWNYIELMKENGIKLGSTGEGLDSDSSEQSLSALKKAEIDYKLARSQVRLFWFIVVLELIVALMYVIASVALLRLYPIGRIWVLLTLILDCWMKFFVIIYEKNVSFPLQRIFKNHSIIDAYFMPNKDWTSELSYYFSGLRFLTYDGIPLLWCYLIVIFLTFYLFSKYSMIKTFGR